MSATAWTDVRTRSKAGTCCRSARTLSDWAAFFAAHCRCRSRCGDGNHGVSDPAARARSGPAPVPRGRSRHGCLCHRKLSSARAERREAPRVPCIKRARSRLRSSGRSGPVCPAECRPRTSPIRAPSPCRSSRQTMAEARCRLASTLATSTVHNARNSIRRDGHHDDDAPSVLGTVQGAALRSARAYARPCGP